jgi:xylulokinase
MRRKAEVVAGRPLRRVAAAGGGTHNRRWLQIKTDVFGCPVDILAQEETTLLGAALLAGLGSGVYADLPTLRAYLAYNEKTTLWPDTQRSATYRRLFEDGYLKLEPFIQAIELPTRQQSSTDP